MTTTWTLIASQVCRDGLEHLKVVGADETVDSADQNLALRALDAVLKELPLAGYSWPKLSGEVALTWASGTPQTIALPADYYGYPVVHKTISGKTIPLEQIPHAEWVTMLNREATAPQPLRFYVNPAKTLYFWPIPTADPVALLQYQKIVDDSVTTTAPDIPQYMLNALGFGVAYELRFKFALDQAERLDIEKAWQGKKKLALESSIPSEVITFSVAD